MRVGPPLLLYSIQVAFHPLLHANNTLVVFHCLNAPLVPMALFPSSSKPVVA